MNAAGAISLASNSSERPRIADKEFARIQCYTLLIISDLVALAIAFLGANAIYLNDLDSQHGTTMLTVLAPIYIFVAALTGAYNGQVLEYPIRGISRSLQAFAVAAAAILFVAYFLKAGSEFSRFVFGLGVTATTLLLPLSRIVLRRPILRLLGGTPYTTVVICDGVQYHGLPYDVVLTPEQLQFDATTKDPMSYHRLAQTVAHADRLIVACPQERYVLWSSVLKSMALDGEILTDAHDELGLIGISRHGPRQTMVVSTGPLRLRDRILKRTLDLVLSIVGILLLLPLFAAMAIAIKLESRGPIFFTQSRIGRDNKLFRIYKFRSMHTDQCDANAQQLTRRGDSRLTRVGEFMRRTSIDELPQLFNVLQGTMSIVGPRPHAISAKAADLLYWDVDPRYRHRHSMKPGLTGLAQIRGFRGATDSAEDLTNRLMSDLEYVSNWSIWTDIWIILKTIHVLRHDNAF